MSLNRSCGMKLRSSFRGSVNSWARGAGCNWNVLCPGSVFAGHDTGPRLWPGIICSQPPRQGSLHQEFLLRGNHGASTYIQACLLWPDPWLTYIPAMMEQSTLERLE